MTPAALSARSASLFSRFRKKREEQEPPVGPASEERRKYMPGEDGGLLKNEMQHLKSKTKGLTNRKPYKPPPDVEDRVERITSPHCEAGQDWRQLELTDPTLKFKVLTSLIKEFNHDVPNTTLHDIKTVSDVVEFFSTEVRLSSALEDLGSLDLPRNLHIQTKYIRFDPDNKDDPLTKGRTAFPGVNTYVTSIKYKRKYSDIITVKPKPGYTNYYEGY